MEPNWAAQHLQTIRTLMERSAVYRRALAPVMIVTGCIGVAASISGWLVPLKGTRDFVLFWYGVALLAGAAAFFLVRRQAWKQSEPFWSPPTRRVAQALLPPLTAGFLIGVFAMIAQPPAWWIFVALPCLWTILYGCALHAAGFFMPRGMKVFGWAFIVGGLACLWILRDERQLVITAYSLMGVFFGVMHLAYGVYLYFTEPRGTAT